MRRNLFYILVLAMLFISMAICNYSCAQQINLSGYVINHNKTPIADVNIKVLGTNKGTKTNIQGYFSLKDVVNPSTILFSHLSYENYYGKLVSDKDSQYHVVLRPKTYMLGEISIQKNVKRRLTDKYEYISSFEIFEDKIIYIGLQNRRLNRASLVLLDFSGKVITKLPIEGKSELFKDCIGNVHLVQSDTAYQLFYDGIKIHKLYPASKEFFYEKLNDCITTSNNLFIYKKYYNNNQTLLYYSVNSETGKYHDMWMDESALGKSIFNQKKYLNEFEERFYKEIFVKPIYCPMFKANDEIIVFNHIDNTIDVFNEHGIFIDSRRIVYHASKKWDNLILHDEGTESFYAVFDNGGIKTLIKINEEKGTLTEEKYMINGKPFPKNLKIHNGVALFIYRDKDNLGYSRLYFQKLAHQ
ncbi:MAG: carboxypeptidase-like regulatory domain-containing protein [Salinivirgaceae bacterium]|nr:carboxypeptidase-like regulatory domain-containing protein [Salinivirgaceae bacterium]